MTIGHDDLPGAGPVPRHGDPEPDRVRGHVSAAGGADRPLHAQDRDRLPGARRGADDRAAPARRRRRSCGRRSRSTSCAALQRAVFDGLRRPGARQLRGRARDRDARARPSTAWPSSRSTSPTAPARAGRSASSRRRGRSRSSAAATTCSPRTSSALAKDALRHRLVLTYQALAEEVSAGRDPRRGARRGARAADRPRPGERRVNVLCRARAPRRRRTGPGPGRCRTRSCARSTSTSAAGSRACSPATTARRCSATAPSWRRSARTSRATTCARSTGTSPRGPASRTCASTSPSACSSPGSCSTPRRRCSFGTADRRKADVAEGVALAIGHVATRRGNRLGVVTFGDAEPALLPAAAGAGRPARAARPRCGEEADEARVGATSLGEALAPDGRARPAARARRASSPTSAGRSTGAGRCSRSPAATTWSRSRSATRASRSCRTPASSGSSIPETGRQLRVDTRRREAAGALRQAAAAEERSGLAQHARRPLGVRHVVLDDLRRLAALAGAVPRRRRPAVSFQSPTRAARRSCSCRCSSCAVRRARSGGRGAYAARFANPALLPNLVDRAPGLAPPPAGRDAAGRAGRDGRRRRAPARDRQRPARGGDRDAGGRRLALDGRERRRAVAARRRAARPRTRSWRKVPEKFRVGVVSFALARRASRCRRPQDRPLVAGRRSAAAPGRGDRARRRDRARGDSSGSGSADRRTAAPPTVVLADLRRREQGRPDDARGRRAARAARLHIPVYTIVLGTRDGVVDAEADGRLTEQRSACRRARRRCRQIARHDRRQVLHGDERRAAARGLRAARLAARPQAAGAARSRTSSPAAPARCSCSSAAPCRRSGSGGSREAAALVVLAVLAAVVAAARSTAGAAGRARTSAAASWSACRSPGRGSSSRRRSACPAAAGRVPALLPEGLHRRRARRRAERPRDRRRRSSASSGSPVNPGIDDRRARRLRRDLRRHVGARRRASGRTSAACPRRGGGRGSPTAVALVPPGSRRCGACKTVRVLRRHASAWRRVRARASGSSSASHALGFCGQRPPDASLAASLRGAPGGRAASRVTAVGARAAPRSRPCARSSRSHAVCARGKMSFGHPLLLLTLLVDPAGDRAVPARRAAADALRGRVHEPRRARVGRGRTRAGAASSPPRCSCSRSRRSASRSPGRTATTAGRLASRRRSSS